MFLVFQSQYFCRGWYETEYVHFSQGKIPGPLIQEHSAFIPFLSLRACRIFLPCLLIWKTKHSFFFFFYPLCPRECYSDLVGMNSSIHDYFLWAGSVVDLYDLFFIIWLAVWRRKKGRIELHVAISVPSNFNLLWWQGDVRSLSALFIYFFKRKRDD